MRVGVHMNSCKEMSYYQLYRLFSSLKQRLKQKKHLVLHAMLACDHWCIEHICPLGH